VSSREQVVKSSSLQSIVKADHRERQQVEKHQEEDKCLHTCVNLLVL